jgi:mRNA-degrading endonuclease toxin of MazEF toxin-antitoxin module
MSYKQGSIVWLDFKFTDHSDKKERPVLIISNSALENFNEVIAVKITTTFRRDGFGYELKPEMLSEPLDEKSFVRFGTIMTFSVTIFSSRKKPITLKRKYLDEVIEKVKEVIELE